ncbi:MAG: addiction module protein [Bacteroidota bacterium]
MTQIVEKIYSLAQQATRMEQYAAINAILALLEESDATLTTAQVAELDRREALLREGNMPIYTVDEVMEKITSKIDQQT